MNLVLDEFVGTLEKFAGNNDDRGSTITDFAILLLSKLHQNLTGRMLNVKKIENSSTIIGDSDVLY